MKLQGKTAIVTGAAAGIGAASAALFMREGANVVAVDIDAAALHRFTDALGGTCIPMQADVSRQIDVEQVVARTIKTFGRLDILFNNAGVVASGKIDATTEDVWDRTMSVNVKSIYLFCHAAIPIFKKQGGGVILNTSSATALRAVGDRACYTTSKAAVVGLTKSIAIDHAIDNIRANCLCPGTVETPSLAERIATFPDPGEARKRFIARQPLGRFGTAEEIAAAALYLVSEDAAFVTGVAFPIDGGLTI